jgi:hypothetical protein
MAYRKVSVDEMAEAVMELMSDIRDVGADELKKAVKKAGKDIKDDINASAPVRTGRYARSWRQSVTQEDSTSIQVTVYSPSRYMLAHLLEHGHAKRGGGRVRAFPHIEPAENRAMDALEEELARSIKI